MVTKPIKRPRDPIALAKLIGDIATGQVEDKTKDMRDPAAVALGSKGGKAQVRHQRSALASWPLGRPGGRLRLGDRRQLCRGSSRHRHASDLPCHLHRRQLCLAQRENRLKRDAGDFNWQGLAFSLDPATYAK